MRKQRPAIFAAGTAKSPKGGVKNKLITAAIVILGLFAAVIYLNEKFFNVSWIPEWHEIYEAVGLSKAAYGELSEGEIAVHFIDVGQGDCELIIAGGKTVLIDAGEASELPNVIKYLKSLGIKTLDTVIATHPHSDHIGSLAGVINEFGTKILIMPELPEEMTPVTSSYRNLVFSADDCGAEIRQVRAGDSAFISEGCTLEFSAPLKCYEGMNDNSIVARLVYGDTSFLFTGDIEREAEQDIYDSGAELSADVIKAAHHGSSSSSLKVFVQAVSPKYAVISVGSPNDYGHPHRQTLDLFDNLGIEVYRTDRDGSITFISDGKKLKIHTGKEREAA